MIALLRRQVPIIQYYDQKITGETTFRQQFLPMCNRENASHLCIAGLCSDCQEALELIQNKLLVQLELPLNAAKESFFGVVCTFGQLKPLEALLQLTDLMPLIYKCLLQYIGKPSYLDLCDRDIDYELFGTSKTQKMQVKRRMARLLQDALDYCSNQTEFEWIDLAQQWRKNPIYYYSSDDVEKKHG